MFITDKEIAAESVAPGITRKIMAHAGGLMLVRVCFEAGAVGALHSHPHEQVTYVVRGRFLVTIGSDTQELTAGDSFYTHPHVQHTVTALEPGELADIFTPQREDFLK